VSQTHTRVLVAASVRLYREGVAAILGRHERIELVGTASSRDETVEKIRVLAPDVVVVDTAMPGSLEAVRTIVAAAPDTRVVAIAVPESEREVIARAEAGVAGYVTRDASIQELVQVVESAARDEAICSPRIAASLLRRVAALAAEQAPALAVRRLTSREREVVRLIDEGLSNKQIAGRLCIEPATVKNHVHNILEKLHVRRRSEVAALVGDRIERADR